jgi:hypothetical protein
MAEKVSSSKACKGNTHPATVISWDEMMKILDDDDGPTSTPPIQTFSKDSNPL